jgi:multiple sugar transport system permease protein
VNNKKKTAIHIIIAILLLIPAVIAISPFFYMLYISLTQADILSMRLDFSGLSFINYIRVLTGLNFFNSLKNSAIVTLISCVLNCIVSSMAAYAFAKKKFPFRESLFALYLATLMVPGYVTMIPLFISMSKLGMLNSYFALSIPVVNAFGVFLIKQFMGSVPDDMLEAARIDGCGEAKTFIYIVLPLVRSVLITLAVFTFLNVWNDFLWPLMVINDNSMATLTLSLANLTGNYRTNYGIVMAGATLAFMPPFVLYVFCQKQFVEGIAMSGIKS